MEPKREQPSARTSGPGSLAADHELGSASGESEVRLRAILDNAVDSIITIDEHGIIMDVNPAVQRLFGYRPEEIVGRNINILMPDPYRREHDGYLRHYRTTGERRIIGIGREVAGRRKDGTVFPLELTVSEVRFAGRRLFTGIIRDVTERKRVEDERQKFVSLVENSSDFIAMASLEWQLLYVNKAGQDLLGITPSRSPRSRCGTSGTMPPCRY